MCRAGRGHGCRQRWAALGGDDHDGRRDKQCPSELRGEHIGGCAGQHRSRGQRRACQPNRKLPRTVLPAACRAGGLP